MKDYETGVLEQYHIEVNSTRKIRGAVLCDTAQGWFLLKEAGVSLKRISMLQKLYENLQETGLRLVDRLIENTEGNLISIGEDGRKYWLKQWFCGRECDIRKEYELTEAVKNLTGLHSRLRGMFPEEEFQEINLCEEYQRHNRELKKVRSFIRQKVGKGDFETAFLNCFDPMYEWADSILNQFRQSGYQELYRGSKEQGCMIHGEYNY
ncbi:MAG: MarR family transcriptional regulator, partial [Hungatella sp.]